MNIDMNRNYLTHMLTLVKWKDVFALWVQVTQAGVQESGQWAIWSLWSTWEIIGYQSWHFQVGASLTALQIFHIAHWEFNVFFLSVHYGLFCRHGIRTQILTFPGLSQSHIANSSWVIAHWEYLCHRSIWSLFSILFKDTNLNIF